jgi:putative sigma-54 modulation protein
MKIKVSFKHIEHTPALDEQIYSKSEKLEKYFDGNFEIHWICYAKDDVHVADIKLLGPSFNYHASAKSESLYKCFDLVIAKLEKQVVKKKSKWKNNLHHRDAAFMKNVFVNEIIKDEEESEYVADAS